MRTDTDVLLITIDALRVEEALSFLEAGLPWQYCAPCWSTAPITPVALSSILSGRLPQVHGVRNVRDYALRPECPWLPEILRDAGFFTFAAGGMVPLYGSELITRGFTYRSDSRDDSELRSGPGWVSRSLRRAAQLARADKPVFAFVHSGGCHQPLGEEGMPFRKALRTYRKTAQDEAEDVAVGVQDWIVARRADGRGRVLVIVTGDHGDAIAPQLPSYWFAHGHTVEDSALMVPLLAAEFGADGAEDRALPWREHEVSHLDIAPTIARHLGIPDALPGAFPLQSHDVAPCSRVHYAESYLRPFHDGAGVATVRRGYRRVDRTIATAKMQGDPEWARPYWSIPADYHPRELREAFSWLVHAISTSGEPLGFLLEVDPWSLATLALLQDLGWAGVRVYLLTQDGRPGGATALPGRAVVDPDEAAQYLDWLRDLIRLQDVVEVELPAGADPYRTIAESQGVSRTMILGRWPDPYPDPTRRQADVGRVWASFTEGISLRDVAPFLESRGIQIPPGWRKTPRDEDREALTERLRALGYM